ncbi:MAG: hypothetical protein ABWK01_06245 [Infirmifilum sp.]
MNRLFITTYDKIRRSIDRREELELLERLCNEGRAHLIFIYGREELGKRGSSWRSSREAGSPLLRSTGREGDCSRRALGSGRG